MKDGATNSRPSIRASTRWARVRWPLVGMCATGAWVACTFGRSTPGADLGALAAALATAAGGAQVSAADLRWEPSRGALGDLVFGRRLLFLARGSSDETRDVWRARVRVAPDGAVLSVASAHDLTNTPVGDEHELVALGRYAAFATRAYGQEQTVTLLDLAGEGPQNKTARWADRAMAAITNWTRTGSPAGIGRIDITFDAPGRALALALSESSLRLTLYGGDAHRAPTVLDAQLDTRLGDFAPPSSAMHAEPAIHLPKRFSHWAVDTLRAVPWIGPAPVAWVEDQALAARDRFRRLTFSSGGAATDVVAAVEPPPPVLDTSQASVDEGHWPPQPVSTVWKSPEPGEGQWVVPEIPWLRRPASLSPDAPSPFYQTFVRPDEERPYAKVLLVAMDMRQLDLDMEAGVEDPEPVTGPPGSGRIPRDPSIYRRVAAVFNGAFKTEHGHYGMMVKKRVLLPPVPGAATVVTLADGRVGIGTWGADRRVGGIAGVVDDQILSFRQNLDPLVDRGQLNPAGRNLWGFTLPGKGAQTERSGLCVTTSGHLIYAWGDDVSGTTLAKAMQWAGCDYGMHLDMNPYHTGFLFTAIEDLPKKYKSQLLTTAMSIPADRYIQYSSKDFFYVLAHDPTPAPVEGAGAWVPDDGAQPPPRWLPGLWSVRAESPEGPVELLDVEPGRATWRIRAGQRDATAATPLRDIGGDESKRVLLAAGLGAAPDKRPLGMATDGRLAMGFRGGSNVAALIAAADGHLSLERTEFGPPLDTHADAVELPVVAWDGQIVPTSTSAATSRVALGIAASGRVLLGRGTFTSVAPIVAALVRAGCTRVVSLDRGLLATGRIDRTGTDHPPLSRYDESVLFAVGMALHPRGFRFEPSTLVAQSSKSK